MKQQQDLVARLRDTALDLAALERLGPTGVAGTSQREALKEDVEDILDRLHPEDAIPPPPPSDMLAPEGLAVVVGHTRASQGAGALSPPFPARRSTDGLSARHEYAWNTDLALRIRQRAQHAGMRCEIFFRDGVGIAGAYANVRRWSPRATVELHFNAGGGNARGSLVLYGSAESQAWAEALQRRIVALLDRRGRSEDRGVFIPGPQRGYERGLESVTQLHPSALIEPFFGDNPSDAAMGMQKKDGLADAIVAAFAGFSGLAAPPPDAVQGAAAPDGSSVGAGLPDVPLLRDLLATYRGFTPAVPDMAAEVIERLKAITLAQWIEESGWARSDLAERHFNFAGMKAISEVDAIIRNAPARRVDYVAHDGPDKYLAFGSIRDFIRGYFMFLDRSPYRGWREMASRSPHDFIRFIGRTWAQRDGYASRVIAIERRLADLGIARADGSLAAGSASAGTQAQSPAGAGIAGIDMAAVKAAAATPDFLTLVAAQGSGGFPDPLAPVIVAQCALESDWGRSDLARIHNNYAGIPWSDLYGELAIAVPHPADPSRGTFCRFLSPATFLRAYRHRLDNDPAFTGWRAEAARPAAFAGFLGRTWRPSDRTYAEKIVSIAERIATGGGTPAEAEEPQDAGDSRAGAVLRVTRLRAERRRGQGERTVGSYELFINGRPVEGVTGMLCEARGPGSNGREAIARNRIRAGTYPLRTHAGSKYRTHGFSGTAGIGAQPRPAIGLGGTDPRSAILIHPAQGFLWSAGCLNLSGPLGDASSDIVYGDSRSRVLALMEALREALGERFPTGANLPIPGATIEVVGEPGPAGSDALGAERDITPEAYLRQALAVADAALASGGGDALAGADHVALHDALAVRMSAAAVLRRPLSDALDRMVAQGVGLADLRGSRGETLWTPWSLAVSASLAAGSSEGSGELAKVAPLLKAAGVPLDDGIGDHSAVVTAAMANDADAIEALLAQGATVDFTDRSGVTPLLAAAFFGAPEAAALLLGRGADPRATVALADAGAGGDDESAGPGDDAVACAAQGAAFASGNPGRAEDFERVAALLWDVLNPA